MHMLVVWSPYSHDVVQIERCKWKQNFCTPRTKTIYHKTWFMRKSVRIMRYRNFYFYYWYGQPYQYQLPFDPKHSVLLTFLSLLSLWVWIIHVHFIILNHSYVKVRISKYNFLIWLLPYILLRISLYFNLLKA